MKKSTARLGICLGIMFVVYILVAFLIPFAHTDSFWTAFLFTIIAFATVAVSLYMGFVKHPDIKSKFYGFPVVKIGMIYGIAQLIFGLLCMALGRWIPAWAAAVVSVVGLGIALVGMIGADAVADEIKEQDVQLKKNVSRMRGLQSRVNSLVSLCEASDVNKAMKELAEELRYSDPVSTDAASEAEAALIECIFELENTVGRGEFDSVIALIAKTKIALKERNELCKLSK